MSRAENVILGVFVSAAWGFVRLHGAVSRSFYSPI